MNDPVMHCTDNLHQCADPVCGCCTGTLYGCSIDGPEELTTILLCKANCTAEEWAERKDK